ncbi:MAG: hypothetical protein R3F61_29195 [Myxococcota bacterium]
MRALTLTLALLFGSTALASSELQLKSNMPVQLVIDDEDVGTVQPLEPLIIDIEPGVHNVQIRGMMGKSVYDRDLIFDDDTRTELVWQRKELRLGAVVQLDPNRPKEDPESVEDLGYESGEQVADAEGSEAPEAPEAPETPEPVERAEAPRPDIFGPDTPSRPSAPPSTPAAQAPPAPTPEVAVATPPPVKDVRPPAPPRAAGGSVVIEAQPGMDLQITHGSQKLRVTVENGELVVVDANGTEIHFPSDGDAW